MWLTLQYGYPLFTFDVKNVHKKVLSFVSSRRFGINPFISGMFKLLGQNQTFTAHARQMMHMLFETCAREELNKLELYIHAAGGKRFKFEDNPSFFSLSGCSATVHLLDNRLSCPGCCCARPH